MGKMLAISDQSASHGGQSSAFVLPVEGRNATAVGVVDAFDVPMVGRQMDKILFTPVGGATSSTFTRWQRRVVATKYD